MTGFFRPPLDQGHIGNHRTKNWESWSHADGADHATLDMQWVARDLMDTCSTCHFPVNFTWLWYMVIISFYHPHCPHPLKIGTRIPNGESLVLKVSLFCGPDWVVDSRTWSLAMKQGGAPFAMQLYVEIRPFGLKLVDSSPHSQLSARATQWWI